MGTEAEIESLVRAFEAGNLPKPEWTHRAHLTVALWYLRRHPRAEATRRIRGGGSVKMRARVAPESLAW